MITTTPYTDADVKTVADAIARTWGRRNLAGMDAVPDVREGLGAREDARAVLEALAAAGRLAPVDDDPRHIIQFRPDGWTIKHPLACRAGDLFGCRVNLAAEDFDGPPVPPGRYAVTVDDIDGRLRIGERVDALTSAAPAVVPGRHVLAVADNRAWEIEHPGGCTVHTPAGPAVICLVHDLAVEQLPPGRVPPPGRYWVEANDIGDLLLIGDRLDASPAVAVKG